MLQVCITGALGIPGSGRDRNYTRNCFVSKTYDFNVAVDRSFTSTHVQYTQTDTIRQTDGPLVPMIRLVLIEKHPIPMVLLVNMHLIKGTWIIFPCDLVGYRAIPMVHWFQWKSTLFQWFCW